LSAENLGQASKAAGVISMNDAYFGDNPVANKNFAVVFLSFSTRNAGYYTVDPSVFTGASKMLNIFEMIVGGSPSSTAGGIRTTTIAIVIIALYKKLRGLKHVNVFKRTIPEKIVYRSVFTTICAIALVALASFIIAISSYNSDTITSNYVTLDYMYEVGSAFGTTGLSSN
jgi:Trk-type K+ transport system membrane component